MHSSQAACGARPMPLSPPCAPMSPPVSSSSNSTACPPRSRLQSFHTCDVRKSLRHVTCATRIPITDGDLRTSHSWHAAVLSLTVPCARRTHNDTPRSYHWQCLAHVALMTRRGPITDGDLRASHTWHAAVLVLVTRHSPITDGDLRTS